MHLEELGEDALGCVRMRWEELGEDALGIGCVRKSWDARIVEWTGKYVSNSFVN